MKKILVLLVAFVFGFASVNAMTESELKEKLTQSYTVNGTTFKATDAQKTLIERYLEAYEVSSEHADIINQKLQASFDVLKNSGKKDFKYLSNADKQTIIGYINDVNNQTSIECAVVNGELVVYEPDTNKTEEFYRRPLDKVDEEIVFTNGGYIVAGLGILSVIGMAIAFKKIRNA